MHTTVSRVVLLHNMMGIVLIRASYCTHAVLIIRQQSHYSVSGVYTFDISILYQVSLLAKIDLTIAEYPSHLAPSRAGVLMDVEV